MQSKAQSATEFIVLASFMLLVILGFFAVTSSNILEAKEEGNRKIAEDIAEFAYREIEIAKSASNGYARVFSMPRTVNGISYSINITDNIELVISYLGYEYVKYLPSNVSGNISRGLNAIKKADNIIFINSISGECENKIDDDSDTLTDLGDPGCYLNCNYLAPGNYKPESAEYDSCSCISVGVCCVGVGQGGHYSLFESSCAEGECRSKCIGLPVLTMKNSLFRIMRFADDGNIVMRGTLEQNANPQQTSDDEFVFKDRNGNIVAVANLVTGNVVLKGSLMQNQPALTPSASSSDFVIKDPDGNVVSYIDESGNLLLKGSLTQNWSP